MCERESTNTRTNARTRTDTLAHALIHREMSHIYRHTHTHTHTHTHINSGMCSHASLRTHTSSLCTKSGGLLASSISHTHTLPLSSPLSLSPDTNSHRLRTTVLTTYTHARMHACTHTGFCSCIGRRCFRISGSLESLASSFSTTVV